MFCLKVDDKKAMVYMYTNVLSHKFSWLSTAWFRFLDSYCFRRTCGDAGIVSEWQEAWTAESHILKTAMGKLYCGVKIAKLIFCQVHIFGHAGVAVFLT